ncbi:hypothetical protein HBI56_072300 [Parastagonospora nodorum]|uniref:Uncharacterized protein n=1 Tax=Phaeosphaeria nodorum (strain SN15 / ATCC MYA-4574 / FGSC 10173) TaxID=321614 RepID=A0A7U2HXS9_PHANO|nr:hypothetical protein HBH56_172690 [Parastagonospora nodorum]QRC94618.1 hypothetical protein JI435_406100 [Parastagonospora nodorum SN15]KAH3928612.1 hypothetical protein HBH54_141250 [Parastagonospora nodorum]KAH3945246.1 hypothetical protein HBH53_146770 [Parastagonospora nodorum]KAH3983793.1 hypothetical protein HBH52_057620 [Parastagonospora nodorum]
MRKGTVVLRVFLVSRGFGLCEILKRSGRAAARLAEFGRRDTPSSTEDACGLAYPPAHQRAHVTAGSSAHALL